MSKKQKTYAVIRIVKEEFEVVATSKKEAADNVENPHTITVVKETIKLQKP